jgi:hypothetical protein
MKGKALSAPVITQEQFDNEMAFTPREYFFSTMEEFLRNMNKRIEFLRIIERSEAFTLSNKFREDFLLRND